MKNFYSYLLSFSAIALFQTACKPAKTAEPAPKANQSDYDQNSGESDYYDQYDNGTTQFDSTGLNSNGSLTIQQAGMSGQFSSTIMVQQNIPKTISFEALESDGYTRGTITRILVNGQQMGSGSTLTFTPSGNNLNGTIMVYATSASTGSTYGAGEQSQSFFFSADGNSVGGINGLLTGNGGLQQLGIGLGANVLGQIIQGQNPLQTIGGTLGQLGNNILNGALNNNTNSNQSNVYNP